MTLKNIVDDISELLTKFGRTDDSRLDDDWLSYKFDQVCGALKVEQYAATNSIDHTWLSPPMTVNLHKVNFADDPSILFCDCDISKASIPQTLSLISKDGNNDLGLYSLISACGTKQYFPMRMSQWRYTPPEHTNSLFRWYDRMNTTLYVKDAPAKLKLVPILLNPTDGRVMQSEPVLSGSVVNGTVYVVKFGQVIYNATIYRENETITATATTTYTGNGVLYLNSQVRAFRDTDPYPASGDMVRKAVKIILVEEFGIERQAVNDLVNDSRDDIQKG